MSVRSPASTRPRAALPGTTNTFSIEACRRVAWRVAFGACVLALVTTPPAQAQTPQWQASAWLGYTGIRDQSQGPVGGPPSQRFGLRMFKLGFWYTPEVEMWVRYNDDLSLHNFALAPHPVSIPALYAGGQVDWAGRSPTRIEIGWRRVPAGALGESLLDVQQRVALPDLPLALRFGAWAGFRTNGVVEWVGNAGFSWIPSRMFHLDPTVIFARSGVQGERVERARLFGELGSDTGVRVGLGLTAGRAWRADTSQPVDVVGGSLSLSARVGAGNRINLLVRHQDAGAPRGFTIIALGFTLNGPDR